MTKKPNFTKSQVSPYHSLLLDVVQKGLGTRQSNFTDVSPNEWREFLCFVRPQQNTNWSFVLLSNYKLQYSGKHPFLKKQKNTPDCLHRMMSGILFHMYEKIQNFGNILLQTTELNKDQSFNKNTMSHKKLKDSDILERDFEGYVSSSDEREITQESQQTVVPSKKTKSSTTAIPTSPKQLKPITKAQKGIVIEPKASSRVTRQSKRSIDEPSSPTNVKKYRSGKEPIPPKRKYIPPPHSDSESEPNKASTIPSLKRTISV